MKLKQYENEDEIARYQLFLHYAYELRLGLFLIVVLDWITTSYAIHLDSISAEGNPVVAMIITHYTIYGFLLFKIIMVSIIICLLTYTNNSYNFIHGIKRLIEFAGLFVNVNNILAIIGMLMGW